MYLHVYKAPLCGFSPQQRFIPKFQVIFLENMSHVLQNNNLEFGYKTQLRAKTRTEVPNKRAD